MAFLLIYSFAFKRLLTVINFTLSIHLFMHAWAYLWCICVCMYGVPELACIPVEVRLGVLFYHPALFPWDSLLLNLEIIVLVVRELRIHLFHPHQPWWCMCAWLFHIGAGHSNSGAHACTLLFFSLLCVGTHTQKKNRGPLHSHPHGNGWNRSQDALRVESQEVLAKCCLPSKSFKVHIPTQLLG